MQRRRAPDVKTWLYQWPAAPGRGVGALRVSDRDGAETLWLMDVESQVTRQRRLFDADTWQREAC